MLFIFENRCFFKESGQTKSKREGINIKFRNLRLMKIDFYHSASRAHHKKELALSNFIEKQRILSFYLQIFCA